MWDSSETDSFPHIHLNFALSCEGRVAADDGQAICISCPTDWRRVHLLRESYDAVAVGARTFLLDRPRLNVRSEVLGRKPCRQPDRVVFAGTSVKELDPAPGRRTFFVGPQPPTAKVIHVPAEGRNLAPALHALARQGVRSMLVEGGPTLLASFLEQGLFHRLTIYVATPEPQAALAAAARVLRVPPTLSAAPFGQGTLLSLGSAPETTDLKNPVTESSLAAGCLTYLDPDACGLPNGGRRGERLALLGPIPLPVAVGHSMIDFSWYVFGRVAAGCEAPAGPLASSILVHGAPAQVKNPLVRLHSGCHTGDIFGSMRCDCGAQLDKALLEIVACGAGAAVYLTHHEGRGIGLWAKAQAYLLQDAGLDTYEANRRLGLPEDSRCYDDAAVILATLLKGRQLRLLSNNPAKRDALMRSGFEVEMVGLQAGHNEINHEYLAAKVQHGHRLKLADSSINSHSRYISGMVDPHKEIR